MEENAGQQPEQPWQSWQPEQPVQPAQPEQPWWQAPAPQQPEQPWQPPTQHRQFSLSRLPRQLPTPVIAGIAAVLGAVSMLAFHGAVAHATNDNQTTPTTVTVPQNGGQQQDNSGLTFPRFRFGNGAGSGQDDGSGQSDPFSGLEQGLQGMLQGQGQGGNGPLGGLLGNGGSGRSTGTNAAATAISPAIVDINVTLNDGEGAGSGIVLTPNGEILTNNHVISGATSITATDVDNGKTYKAVVVGYDRGDDVAVLQLQNASGLTTAKIAPTAAKVGDAVIGVGNAQGAGGTPSWASGTVTALNQSITATSEDGSSPESVGGLIESTTPIEPGDSGGPLVNSAGEVVGMDTAGEFSSLRSAASSAYAVPIAKALDIAGAIEKGDTSNGVHIGTTPILGVMIRSDRATGNGNGVLIDEVVSGGPAAKAGLQGGDTITAINGTKVNSPTALTDAILTHRAGDPVSVSYTDGNGAKHTATVTLGSGPAQ
jgi:S1-C subfamily serine protease